MANQLHESTVLILDKTIAAHPVSYASDPQDVKEAKTASMQITVTASSGRTGTLTYQASNDGVNFADLGSTSIAATAQTLMYAISNCGYNWFKTKYDSTAGAGGTIQCTLAQKNL